MTANMAVSGDVTIAQDGGRGNAKVHPYLVALVRWCVSCLWSTATVVLHRLMTAPLSPITGSKSWKSRPAGKDHLDPQPRVECVVLHQPSNHTMDVIFVHGLYGSLGNTWRQGEWRSKYTKGPDRIHLRRPTAIPTPVPCDRCDTDLDKNSVFNENQFNDKENAFNDNEENMFNDYDNENSEYDNIDDKFYNNIKKMLPKDDVFDTEKFYNNTLLNQVEIVDNYETQVQFVNDLFKNCDNKCDIDDDDNIDKDINDRCNCNGLNENTINDNCNCNGNNENELNDAITNEINCQCKGDDDKQCVGCGCICDECYSPCWPKDWIREDYPGARVISINYTSDPHLWRPLWIKESKRLRLHERADQMTEQLLELGVGQRPVIWVGHSKGGLFIKQIYCDAYEAYLKTKHTKYSKMNTSQNENEHNEMNYHNGGINCIFSNSIYDDSPNLECNGLGFNDSRDYEDTDTNSNIGVDIEEEIMKDNRDEKFTSSSIDEDVNGMTARACLWSNSAGFMFYSVPHRGSPLADIKCPVTARSIELLEISKDCSLVLTLQDRWLRAAAPAQPLVRSLVETRRTLMSVLWLTIVSADSADPGIGALCGISVDHREICKPTSRHCMLYRELATLIRAALNKCRCQC